MEKDVLKPWTTKNSDPATALNGMSFEGGPVNGVFRRETYGEAIARIRESGGNIFDIQRQWIQMEPPQLLPVYNSEVQNNSQPFNKNGQVVIDGEVIHDSK